MPIVPQTTQNPRVVGKTFSGEETAFGPGAQVSLNLSKRSFLATPRREFCLSEQNPTGIIPYDLPEAVYAALKVALDRDEIVMGPQPMTRAVRHGLLEPVYEEIDKAESVEQVKQTVFAIAAGRKRMDGHPPADLVRRLAIHETKTGCRAEFLDFFGSILERVPGLSGVEDHPQDRTTARVLITENGAIGGPMQRTDEQRKALKDLI